MNACCCGFSTPDLNAFLEHVRLHEEEEIETAATVTQPAPTITRPQRLPEENQSEEIREEPVVVPVAEAIPNVQAAFVNSAAEHETVDLVEIAAAEQEKLLNATEEALDFKVPQQKPVARFRCQVCSTTLTTRKALSQHIASRHRVPQSVISSSQSCSACPLCLQPFNAQSEVVPHYVSHLGDTSKCPIRGCPHTGGGLESHLDRHVLASRKEESTFGCETCPKDFYSLIELLAHVCMERHVDEATVIKDIFQTQNEKHEERPSNGAAEDLRMSEQEKASRARFQRFVDKAARQNRAFYACNDCETVYFDKILYYLHKLSIGSGGLHGIGAGRRWTCNVCERSFHDRYEFNTHIVHDQHA